MKYILGLLVVVLSVGSCVSITDDLLIKNDGSGTYKYTVNFSSNKMKINSLLALDSLDGKKVPTIGEIQEKIDFYKDKLSKKEGITNVKTESNFTNFILRIQCDFTSVEVLQKAVREIIAEDNKDFDIKETDFNWLSWDGSKLSRSIPPMPEKAQQRIKKEDAEEMKNGSYISITRFERPVEKIENPTAQLSANKMAVMIKTNPYSLSQKTEILDNTIYLSGKIK